MASKQVLSDESASSTSDDTSRVLSSTDDSMQNELPAAINDDERSNLNSVADLQSSSLTVVDQRQVLNEVFSNWLHSRFSASVQAIETAGNTNATVAPHVTIDVSVH